MNVLLLIVDSLRASALQSSPWRWLGPAPEPWTRFEHAYAAECWTLPSHASMFTGLLPSEHGAHFQTMAYRHASPTIAERLRDAGFATELVTRNPVLDGSLPGITRGFERQTHILSPRSTGLNLPAIMLAVSKPRFRRQVATSGFFHPGQRHNREFIRYFARTSVPADRELLEYMVTRIRELRAGNRRFFLCANLFDVHAPYPPTERGIFRSWRRARDWEENCTMPFVLPSLGSHAYLKPGFRLRERSRRFLLRRYHDAVANTDRKLEWFMDAIRRLGAFDDTMIVVTSDHGEGFGEHGLYLHDASVFDTHLHVPLFVYHPGRASETIDDPVSTRDLHGLLLAASQGTVSSGTILDPEHRARTRTIQAEHFHYPHAPWAAPQYKRDLRATIVGPHKLVERGNTAHYYRLDEDPHEEHPIPMSRHDFADMTNGVCAHG